MNKRINSLIIALLPIIAFGQPQVIPLWENGAPGFENRKDEPEQARDWWVRNVHNPSITVFAPPADQANGCAVVVAPGGGFQELVFDAEGKQVAEFLNKIGVTVFVLKYRLPRAENSPYNFGHVRQDAYRAMRIARSRAQEFSIDPNRIGMLGFSAGGGVTMMVAFDHGNGDATAADPVERLNGRPNFQMMIYPFGNAPQKIPADSPPAFLLSANDDEYGCDQVTMDLLVKFREAKVSVEAHLVAQGKHAFNMGDRSPFVTINHWPQRMADWLQDRGLLKPTGSASASSTAP